WSLGGIGMGLRKLWFRVRTSLQTRSGDSGGRWVLLLLAAAFLTSAGIGSAASWTRLTNRAPSSIQIMIQMTDGTILAQSYNGITWMKLTPDANGSYINGTWSLVAPGLVPRLYYASQV